jgi:hypothetical protein
MIFTSASIPLTKQLEFNVFGILSKQDLKDGLCTEYFLLLVKMISENFKNSFEGPSNLCFISYRDLALDI